jgi:hypothetical protein
MKDLVTGIIAAAFSAFYLMQTAGIKIFGGATAGVTAQTIPRLWGGAMLVLSIILILRSIIAMRKRGEKSAEEQQGILAQLKERREVVYTFVLLILYAALMKPVGFIIMSILYVYLQVWVLTPPEKRTKKMHGIAGGLAVFFSVSLYFVFTKYLMVMLPPGILK